MNLSSLHSNELWIFVLTIVNALLAAEVVLLIVESYQRLASVLFASHFIINDFSSLLNEGVG